MDPTLAAQVLLSGAFVLAVAPALRPARTAVACGLLIALLLAGYAGQRRVSEEFVAEAAVRAIQKIIEARREPAPPAALPGAL